jgi:hypothetical protein
MRAWVGAGVYAVGWAVKGDWNDNCEVSGVGCVMKDCEVVGGRGMLNGEAVGGAVVVNIGGTEGKAAEGGVGKAVAEVEGADMELRPWDGGSMPLTTSFLF